MREMVENDVEVAGQHLRNELDWRLKSGKHGQERERGRRAEVRRVGGNQRNRERPREKKQMLPGG